MSSIVSDIGSRYASKRFQSEREEGCQPTGHNPEVSLTAYQLYNLPYTAVLVGLLSQSAQAALSEFVHCALVSVLGIATPFLK